MLLESQFIRVVQFPMSSRNSQKGQEKEGTWGHPWTRRALRLHGTHPCFASELSAQLLVVYPSRQRTQKPRGPPKTEKAPKRAHAGISALEGLGADSGKLALAWGAERLSGAFCHAESICRPHTDQWDKLNTTSSAWDAHYQAKDEKA